jgi:hypothetical protein
MALRKEKPRRPVTRRRGFLFGRQSLTGKPIQFGRAIHFGFG